jgi:hypothetical protein
MTVEGFNVTRRSCRSYPKQICRYRLRGAAGRRKNLHLYIHDNRTIRCLRSAVYFSTA